jgi:hypothetical protein
MPAKPIANKRVRNLLVMEASLDKAQDRSQRIFNEKPIFRAEERAHHYDFASPTPGTAAL